MFKSPLMNGIGLSPRHDLHGDHTDDGNLKVRCRCDHKWLDGPIAKKLASCQYLLGDTRIINTWSVRALLPFRKRYMQAWASVFDSMSLEKP